MQREPASSSDIAERLGLKTNARLLVGPERIYEDRGEDKWAVVIAYPASDSKDGFIVDMIFLGSVAGELPEWADGFANVLVLRQMDEKTRDEAIEARRDVIKALRKHSKRVQCFDSEKALGAELHRIVGSAASLAFAIGALN